MPQRNLLKYTPPMANGRPISRALSEGLHASFGALKAVWTWINTPTGTLLIICAVCCVPLALSIAGEPNPFKPKTTFHRLQDSPMIGVLIILCAAGSLAALRISKSHQTVTRILGLTFSAAALASGLAFDVGVGSTMALAATSLLRANK